MSGAMSVQQLREALDELGCSTKGHKDELRKRLKRANREVNQLQRNYGRAPDNITFQPHEVVSEADGGWAAVGPSGSTAPKQVHQEMQPFEPKIDCFLVCDVEATCEITPWTELAPGPAGERGELIRVRQPSSRAQARKLNRDYPNEIIEFPVVLVRWNKEAQEYQIGDMFQSYVKPTWRPRLSKFCRDLTGITQAQIDEAPTWNEMEGKLYRFLRAQGLLENPWSWADFEDGSEDESTATEADFQSWDRSRFRLRSGCAWVTHGLADLQTFVPKQSWISGHQPSSMFHKDDPRSKNASGTLRPPMWMRGPLLEIRRSIGMLEHLHVNTVYGPTNRDLTIDGLLLQLGLGQFEGRHHSGIDDTKNIARLVIELGNRVRDCRVGVDKPSHEILTKNQMSKAALHHAVEEEEDSSEQEDAADGTGKKASAAKKANGSQTKPVKPPSPKAGAKSRTKLAHNRNEVEYNCLLPNVDYSAVGDQRWRWMGKKRGEIVWKHPPDPTSLE